MGFNSGVEVLFCLGLISCPSTEERAFSAHPAKKFLAVLARVLDGLLSQVCPHAAPYNDALDLWQSLHAFLDRLDGLSELDKEVTLHNQDLAGFFVSIPLHRCLQAVILLLCKAYDLRECDLREGLHGVYVTVDMTNATAPMRLFRGGYCSRAPKVYSIRMDLFMMAVELSFKLSLLNRLTLLSPMLAKLPMFAAFLHEKVYGPLVLLGCEDGDVFLGILGLSCGLVANGDTFCSASGVVAISSAHICLQ